MGTERITGKAIKEGGQGGGGIYKLQAGDGNEERSVVSGMEWKKDARIRERERGSMQTLCVR